jgi:succinate dehydrogenase / fumarate reductase flavoprotein subunit
MYKQITGEDPYEIPMRIYPAVHYTMGGLWVDYNLMSTIPGLYILGEANFSDHGANRLGASALMQGLADGYFILPNTIGDYLSGKLGEVVSIENEAFSKTESDVKNRIDNLISINGNRTVDDIHKELGLILWENVGMARNKSGLEKAIDSIPKLKDEFWSNVKVTGMADELNPELEKAGRVADFLELGELMARDALNREESCGGHFREEHQTEENEAKRNDKDFSFVAAWEHKGDNLPAELHKEELIFENVELTTRSYK